MKWLKIIISVICVVAFSGASAQTYEDVTVAAGFFGLNSSWGSAWADMDNDGDLDVITIAHVQPHTGSVSQIWRNNGDETFSDVTIETGYLLENGDAHGVVWGDFNNDGDQDFYVVKGSKKDLTEHEHDLMQNNGDGTFSNIAAAAGVLGIGHRGRGGYAVDFDVDGDLDLFFSSFSRGTGDFGNMLFRNDGNMTFVDVAPEAGIARDDDKNRTASWADYNNDGYPDLLIMYPCALYANQGDGTFIETTAAAGIVSHIDCSSSAWADYNNDGLLDVYVTSGGDGKTLPTTHGYLYMNNGDGTFSNTTTASGTENPYDARGVVWGDYDNDGLRDLYIINSSKNNPNRLLKNNGDGTFLDETIGSGAEGYVDEGTGVDATFVDYNNDGALDLFVVNGLASTVGEYLLLKNFGNGNNWLKVDLVGRQSNRDGLMARVVVTTNQGSQMQENNGPSHYMVQDNVPMHFGLGQAASVERIIVTWPNGHVQTLDNIAVGQTLVITEELPPPLIQPPTFVDVSSSAGFFGENLSWAGAWSDFDGDGNLDVYTVGHLPAMSGSISQLWRNNGNSSFSDVTAEKSIRTEPRDVHAALWADIDNDGDTDLAIGKGVSSGDHGDELWQNDDGVTFNNVAWNAGFDAPSIGRGVYGADYDLDGDLDILSLGSMTSTGISNQFFRNEGGMTFANITNEVGALASGENNRVAAWGDYNADGLPDILVAPPCTLYKNQGDGTFKDVTGAAGIQRSDECMSPAWADYDNDGDLDIYITSGKLNYSTGNLTAGFLYRNNGDGTFTDVTRSSGTENHENARGVMWGDYDNDGYQDLFIVNIDNNKTTNRLFKNNSDSTFSDVIKTSGADIPMGGGGLDGAFVDYNNDGFLDLFITNGGKDQLGPYVLLESTGNENQWLKVQLEGKQNNRDGIMTKLILTASKGERSMFREHNGPTHYMAQDSAPVHFGLGQTQSVEQLELIWPGGKIQIVNNLAADQMITLVEGRSIARGRAVTMEDPGCYIWRSNLGWHLRCIGEADSRHNFIGQITSDGIFTSAEPLNLEKNDVFTLDSNVINFNLHSRWGHDTIRFSTTGHKVTFDISEDGSRQPRAVRIGKHKILPGMFPVTLTD